MVKRSVSASATSKRASNRARLLIERMLKEMQKGMRDPSYLQSEQWERMFGAKQNIVVNLQKLVAALAALPDDVMEPARAEAVSEITPEEMDLLRKWLEETA